VNVSDFKTFVYNSVNNKTSFPYIESRDDCICPFCHKSMKRHLDEKGIMLTCDCQEAMDYLKENNAIDALEKDIENRRVNNEKKMYGAALRYLQEEYKSQLPSFYEQQHKDDNAILALTEL
jgi:hypothetical protein